MEPFSFLQFVFLKPGVDWRFVLVNWCSKQCSYLCFCLHLPVKGVVFVPIVPLPLGDLPQSGVWHNISHRREWWERQLACLICKCVLLPHLIGLCITTHIFFSMLLFYLLYVCCWSAKHFRRGLLSYIHFVVCSWSFRTAFKMSKSIKVPLIRQVNSLFCVIVQWNLNTSQLHTQHCVSYCVRPKLKQWTVHL